MTKRKTDIQFAMVNRAVLEEMAAHIQPAEPSDLILWIERPYLWTLVDEAHCYEDKRFVPCVERDAIIAGYVGRIQVADGRWVAITVEPHGTPTKREAPVLLGPSTVQIFGCYTRQIPSFELVDQSQVQRAFAA